MHHITLLAIGKMNIPWVREGCTDYIGRLRRFVDLDIQELPASKEKDPKRQQKDESQRLLAAMRKHEWKMIVLDETGKRMISSGFAAFLRLAFDAGTPLLFVIGGAYGFTDEVRKSASTVIRLSDMTLPHELCRVLFLEQLYRAMEIRRGSGYHH